MRYSLDLTDEEFDEYGVPKEGLKLKDMDYFKNSVKKALDIINNSKNSTTISIVLDIGDMLHDLFDEYEYHFIDDILCYILDIFLTYTKNNIADGAVCRTFYKKLLDDSIAVIYIHTTYCGDIHFTYKLLVSNDDNKKLLNIKESTIFDECSFI